MVWGLDGVVGGVKGLFSSKPTPPASQQHSDKDPLTLQTSPPLNSSASAPYPLKSTSQDATPRNTTAAVPSANSMPSSSPSSSDADYWTNSRSRKQFTIFLAGATFVLISTRIASRALNRKYLQNSPAFYHPSNAPPSIAVNGPVEALEALTVASANVLSTSMMVGGGLLWAFDISSIHDLRRKIRGGLGVDGSGRSEHQVEEEFEEWIASTLERKRRKEEEGSGVSSGSAASRQGIAGLDEVRQQWQNERGRPR